MAEPTGILRLAAAKGLSALTGERHRDRCSHFVGFRFRFREELIRYVAAGGASCLCWIVRRRPAQRPMANWFGLADSRCYMPRHGRRVRLPDGGRELEVETACEVRGGEPFAWIDDLPVAARTRPRQRNRDGDWSFASLWNDRNMGGHWMIARRTDAVPAGRPRSRPSVSGLMPCLPSSGSGWKISRPARPPGLPSPPAESQIELNRPKWPLQFHLRRIFRP